MAWIIDCMGHLPDYYKNIEQFKQLTHSDDEEFKLVKAQVDKDLNNAFIMKADATSVGIFEKEIGIVADTTTETLEFRRKRLINRYTTKPPFTIRWLENQVQTLLGNDLLGVWRDDDVEILYIHINISSYAVLKEFETTIEAVLPLSMLYKKQITAILDLISVIYIGSTAIEHIHIEP